MKRKADWIDASQLKARCAGQWDRIFDALVPGFDERLFDRPGSRHGPCPVCQDGVDRFQFFRDAPETGGSNCRHCGGKPDGFMLVQQANNWSFGQTLKEIESLLGGGVVSPNYEREIPPEILQKREERRRKERAKNDRLEQRIEEVWSQTFPADAPEAEPIRLYFHNRGLCVEQFSPMIRFHPGLVSANEDGEYEGTFCAMVAMVVDRNGSPVTLHRTYLTEDGFKAPVEEAKKLMMYPKDRKTASGGAIHLTGTGPVLNVTEGIETGYAVQAMVGGSVWATVSAPMMANLHVGEPVEAVWVWSDLDRSGDGQKAARKLVDRVRTQGKRATCVMPPVQIPAGVKSVDWLDIYTQWHDSVAADKSRFVKRSQLRRA